MKKLVCIATTVAMVCLSLTECQRTGSGSSLTSVTLSEIAHSTFYAPQYTTIELRYFKNEGIDLTLVNGVGADKAMTALVSRDADVGFMDSRVSIYTYMNEAEDYAVNFAQLTQQTGDFLVGHQPEENFQWSSLAGKKVFSGRANGIPQMIFGYILKKNGLDLKTGLIVDQSISFGLTAAAFTSDGVDCIVEFEPFITELKMRGSGYAVASLGEESGYIPYITYYVRKSYMEKNPELIQKFTNTIQKGMDYVNSHSMEEIVETIQPQFKETNLERITPITDRYKQQDTWRDDTIFEKESFELFQNILEEAGEPETHVPYENLAATEFTNTAAG